MSQALNAGPDFQRALGEQLLKVGKLDRLSLDRALQAGLNTGQRIEEILTRLGLVSERDLATVLADQLNLRLVTEADYPDMPLLEGKVSIRFLKEARVLPLREEPDHLFLAMVDPTNVFALDAIRLLAGRPVIPQIAIPAELEAAIERLYSAGSASPAGVIDTLDSSEEPFEQDLERLKDLASGAPVIRLVNRILTRAVESRASDVHIEPFENRVRVRYRTDGVLHDTDSPPPHLQAAITSRIKIMAKLNIAERRLPQDGRIRMVIRGTPVDLRVSTLPTMHGESVVMRVLDQTNRVPDLASLGISEDSLERYLGILEKPHGILLVTGPTGSGKTTTLYTSLSRISTPDKNVITVEDPVEYELENVKQVQVRPTIGLGFANVLRSILRHDPDVIMIGEMRDVETANIGIQAALTGHLVLSTLHTNDAASSVTRLLDMGVKEYLLTSTLNGVLAQRLVRRLCPQCRAPYRPHAELVRRLELDQHASEPKFTLHRAVGCEGCQNTGYFGRTSIVECLVASPAICELILRHAEASEIRTVAVSEGMLTMYADGLSKALAGQTTIEEVLRVTRDA